MRVLARAYGDRPLDRVAVAFDKKVAYVAAQSVADAIQPGEIGGIGFPLDCVFAFDSALFDSLESAWSDGDGPLLQSLWSKALPIRPVERLAA
jgi:hypothetical protein